MVHLQQSKAIYIFTAVCPLHDIVIGLVLPYADTKTKARHLPPTTLTVPPGPHALLAADQPGGHTAAETVVVADRIGVVAGSGITRLKSRQAGLAVAA